MLILSGSTTPRTGAIPNEPYLQRPGGWEEIDRVIIHLGRSKRECMGDCLPCAGFEIVPLKRLEDVPEGIARFGKNVKTEVQACESKFS